jgi:hypothetical protein
MKIPQASKQLSILPRCIAVLQAFGMVFLVGCKCQKVVIPPSDDTPPLVTMIVGFDNKNDILANNSASEILSPSAKIGMIAIAQDMDGGVHNVRIDGETDTSCVNGTLGQDLHATWLAQNTDTSTTGQSACTTRLTGLNIDLRRVTRCNAGFTFSSANGSFIATATNFSNGSTATGKFSFTIRSRAAAHLPSPRLENSAVSKIDSSSGMREPDRPPRTVVGVGAG